MDLVLMLTQKRKPTSAAADNREMNINVMYVTKVTNALLLLQKQFTLDETNFSLDMCRLLLAKSTRHIN